LTGVEGFSARTKVLATLFRSAETRGAATIVEIGSYEGRVGDLLSLAAPGSAVVAIDRSRATNRGPQQIAGSGQGEADIAAFRRPTRRRRGR